MSVEVMWHGWWWLLELVGILAFLAIWFFPFGTGTRVGDGEELPSADQAHTVGPAALPTADRAMGD